ncbi:membrane integrity-associated transporter subunit PqiC [Azonexus sp. R2A61]|uniref:PqiC family protein n=1 Tax=Azonexus sp. R2A61 TaxID=2744443 RepID=UPI001F2AAA22|nr:PqiC family protein [Azonexus sp. R2A61]
MTKAILGALAVTLLAACSTTPPSRYYVLDTLAQPAAGSRIDTGSLGIGIVRLPEYLARPQIVARSDGARLQLHEQDRWSEPLEDGVRRVLAENLGRRLGPGQVQQLPPPPGLSIGQRLQVDISRFDTGPDNELRLDARWTLSRGKQQADAHESRIRIATDGATPAATVAAMNQALARLSDEIAAVAGATPAGSR